MSLQQHPFTDLPALETLSDDLRMNLADSERQLSAMAGAAALVLSVGRRGSSKWLLAMAGAALIARAWTGKCPWYRRQGIDRRHDASGLRGSPGIKVKQTIEIHRSPGIVFAFWRDLEQLPKVMRHVKEVRRLSDRRSHWKVSGPLGQTLEWDAETTNEIPDQLIAWQTLPGSSVRSAGYVGFEPTEAGGTLLRVNFEFDPPAGSVGAAVASLLGASPEVELAADLAQFKEFAERELPVFASALS